MKKFWFTNAPLFAFAIATASQVFPTAEGTTWQYAETEEGSGSPVPVHTTIQCRLAGTEKFLGKNLLKLETLSNGALSKTELLAVDDKGVRCLARSGKEGTVTELPSPEMLVPGSLKEGTIWKSDGEIADMAVHQDWVVAGMEDVSVAAGNFHAFRFHSQATSPTPIVCDRWFVPGVGFIKEIMVMRSPTGELLTRQTLELAPPSKVMAKLESKNQKFLAGVSSLPIGGFESEFSSSTENIYARWEAHGLRVPARIRAVWIAENVGDIATPNYKIDDAVTVASDPDSHGVFTLSRPETGWAQGTYRIEFYINETPAATVRLTIK